MVGFLSKCYSVLCNFCLCNGMFRCILQLSWISCLVLLNWLWVQGSSICGIFVVKVRFMVLILFGWISLVYDGSKVFSGVQVCCSMWFGKLCSGFWLVLVRKILCVLRCFSVCRVMVQKLFCRCLVEFWVNISGWLF